MRSTELKTFLLFFFLSTLLSCSSMPFVGDEEPEAPPWVQDGAGPGTAAVLPFENLTLEPELGSLVRRSFYSHFTPKAYRDIELSEVDYVLEILGEATSRTWKEHSPTSLGRFLQADFVIYGKVLEYDKFFVGIYSQIALKVEVEVVDGRSGASLWQKTVIQRSHEGGIPFNLFAIIPETVRSGLHLRGEKTLDLIERVSRELVGAIPDPPARSVSPTSTDVLAVSFPEKDLADKVRQDPQEKGYRTGLDGRPRPHG